MNSLKAWVRNGPVELELSPVPPEGTEAEHTLEVGQGCAGGESSVELSREDEDELIARLAAADQGDVVAYDSIDAMIHDLCQ